MEQQIYPWHIKNWQTLASMQKNLPHALLFHGPEGTGIEDFANSFAEYMLCETKTEDGYACKTCKSCHWFSQNSHPDFKYLVPESIAPERAIEERKNDDAEPTKEKRLSQKISIDAVRQLHDFVNISTHRGGFRVIVIYPTESMTQESSNALLKILEEPPASTLFLLVTTHLGALLPTILSRCSKLAFPMPTKHESLQWLQQQQVEQAELWLAQQGGAPISALSASQTESNTKELSILLQHLEKASSKSILKTAEQLQKVPVAQIIIWLQRWLYDLFSQKFAGTVRYFPDHTVDIQKLAETVDSTRLLAVIRQMTDRKRTAEHPLVPRLVLEDMLIEYNGIFTNRNR